MITRMRTSAKKVWSPLRLLCTYFFLAAATVGACVGFCVGGVCALIETSISAALSIDRQDIFFLLGVAIPKLLLGGVGKPHH